MSTRTRSAGSNVQRPRPLPAGIGSGTWFGFRPVQTRRPFEVAIEQIADAIRSGTVRVGDRLPAERILSEQMKISRPTLREAIRVLVDAGVLEVRRGPTGGMFVRSETVPPDVLSAEGLALRMSEVAGVLEARRMLEPRVARLAALYATERDFEDMAEAFEALRSAGSDDQRLQQVHTRFHLIMARATQNDTVVDMVRVLFQRLDNARQLIQPLGGDADLAIELHERTLRAVMAGNAADIEAVMDDHLAQLERAWEVETGRVRIRRIPEFLLSQDERVGGSTASV